MVCLSMRVVSARRCVVYIGLPKYRLCVAQCMSLGCGFLVYWRRGLNGDLGVSVRVKSSRCSIFRRGVRDVLFVLFVCMYFVMVLILLVLFVNGLIVEESWGIWC